MAEESKRKLVILHCTENKPLKAFPKAGRTDKNSKDPIYLHVHDDARPLPANGERFTVCPHCGNHWIKTQEMAVEHSVELATVAAADLICRCHGDPWPSPFVAAPKASPE